MHTVGIGIVVAQRPLNKRVRVYLQGTNEYVYIYIRVYTKVQKLKGCMQYKRARGACMRHAAI